LGFSKNPAYVIDTAVIADHQQILLPTVVRASEAVLERFLPRFKAEISVVPDTPAANRYVITGRINQSLNVEWGDRLTIRNGVAVLVNDKKEEVKLFNSSDLNEFSYTVSAKPGDSLSVVYDLGGYVIAASTQLAGTEPVIQTVTPSKARANVYIAIRGTKFGAYEGTVTLNGTGLHVSSWSDTEIHLKLPASATSGDLVVTQNPNSPGAGGAKSKGFPFAIVLPVVTSVSPAVVHEWEPVTITGLNFIAGGYDTETPVVYYNGDSLAVGTVNSWTDTQIVLSYLRDVDPKICGSPHAVTVIDPNGAQSNNDVLLTVLCP